MFLVNEVLCSTVLLSQAYFPPNVTSRTNDVVCTEIESAKTDVQRLGRLTA